MLAPYPHWLLILCFCRHSFVPKYLEYLCSLRSSSFDREADILALFTSDFRVYKLLRFPLLQLDFWSTRGFPIGEEVEGMCFV